MENHHSYWRHGVSIACTKLIRDLKLEERIDFAYSIPYINYITSWKDHLPIKLIIIGQNPYPNNIYPFMGAALSYDPKIQSSPPKSVRSIAEDLYEYNKTPMSDTIACIRDSWHLLNNGTILINETVLSSIEPSIKSHCGPYQEMEAQCIALQSVITASYFMGQNEFTLVGMGERGALMMDQLKKWCPSNIMKVKAIACRNPAARSKSDSMSQFFTLSNSGVSKVLVSQIAWYKTMPPPKSLKQKRLEQSEKSLAESFNSVMTTKTGIDTELSQLTERMQETLGTADSSLITESLQKSIKSTTKSITAFINSVNAHQMQFIQYVNAAKNAIPPTASSDTMSMTSKKDISVLAAQTPPRKKITATVDQSPKVDIIAELNTTTPRKPNNKISSMKSTTTINADASPNTSSTPLKKQFRDLIPEEAVSVAAFANWFKDNMSDPVYYGTLITISEDKEVGSTLIARHVVREIRLRRKEDSTYDAHDELQNPESRSYDAAKRIKQAIEKSIK